jgi:GntR family transcriptional repressor for pyruvate dehydrogenase complex
MNPVNEAAPRAEQDSDPPGSRVHHAMHGIATFIRERGLLVGDKLPGEAELADRMGVSRNVIREAIRGLSVLGIVDIGNGRKPRVAAATAFPFVMSLAHATQTGQITVEQIWEARSCIEIKAATLAATFRTEAEATRLLQLAQQMHESEDDAQRMTELELQFHQLIAAASRNMLFEHLLASFAPLLASAVPAAWSTRKTYSEKDEVIEMHTGIAKAIALRDPKAAARAMERHFSRAIGYLLQAKYQPSVSSL